MSRGDFRKAMAVVAAMVVLSALAPAGLRSGEDAEASLRAAGWEEEGTGIFTSLPGRKASPGPSGITGEFVLGPGTGVTWTKAVAWDPKTAGPLSLGMSVDNVNATSRDYGRRRAAFPLSVTLVFGKESLDVPFRQRVKEYLASLYYGFSPRGIRLTYAYGNNAPAGSMYRLAEENTVFIVAGREDAGGRVEAKRMLADDFRAAYARDPRGPVTSVIVRAERPSGERGPSGARLSLDFAGSMPR